MMVIKVAGCLEEDHCYFARDTDDYGWVCEATNRQLHRLTTDEGPLYPAWCPLIFNPLTIRIELEPNHA